MGRAHYFDEMRDGSDGGDVAERATAVGEHGGDGPLSAAERDRLAALAAAESLADLVALTGADSEHDAYFAAKTEWADLWRRRDRYAEGAGDDTTGLPGESVRVGNADYHVHGVTHAGTDTERAYLRERVAAMLDAGHAVYVEQGLRRLYFGDTAVCEMDDYRWALARCRDLNVHELEDERFEESPPLGGDEHVAAFSERIRERVYSFIDGYSSVYGETVERVLGDLASAVLTDHEGLATGDEYEAFALRQRAVADPAKLPALQAYYRRSFLPQPVEREWVRRHDPDLEWVTHARNARMADYVVHHVGDAETVHVLCGAAHGPGVAYYLRRHRDGERSVADFELA